MNLYREMRDKQQERVSSYLNKYAFFAFSDDQFKKGLAQLDTVPENLTRIPGGGFIIQDKAKGLYDLLSSAQQERETALKDPVTGEQFAYDMFFSELANHEYSYTGDPAETLEALGMTYETVQADPVLKQAFDRAVIAASS